MPSSDGATAVLPSHVVCVAGPVLAQRGGLAPVNALRGGNAGSDAGIVLRNNGSGEMPIRLHAAPRARHGADPGEQEQEQQKKRPGRGHDAPASEPLVAVLLRMVEA